MNDTWKPILSVIAVFCIALTHTQAQLSSGTILPEQSRTGTLAGPVVSAAGAIRTANVTFRMTATVAQAAIGSTAGKLGSNGQGFWYLLPQLNPASLHQVETDIPWTDFRLDISPNSFSLSTQISLHIQQTRHISITLYDLLGKPVRTLADNLQPEGTLNLTLTAQELPSGYYRIVATDGDHQQTVPIRIVK